MADSLTEVNETGLEEYMKKQMEAAYDDLRDTHPEIAEALMKN